MRVGSRTCSMRGTRSRSGGESTTRSGRIVRWGMRPRQCSPVEWERSGRLRLPARSHSTPAQGQKRFSQVKQVSYDRLRRTRGQVTFARVIGHLFSASDGIFARCDWECEGWVYVSRRGTFRGATGGPVDRTAFATAAAGPAQATGGRASSLRWCLGRVRASPPL